MDLECPFCHEGTVQEVYIEQYEGSVQVEKGVILEPVDWLELDRTEAGFDHYICYSCYTEWPDRASLKEEMD
jgi:hypothetical protein